MRVAWTLLAVVGLGVAGQDGLVEALDRVVTGAGPRAPDMAVVCGPSADLIERLAALSALGGPSDVAPPGELSDLFTRPEAASEAGLDLAGHVSFGLYLEERQGWLSLPLTRPEPEVADRLMNALHIDHVLDGAGWRIEEGDVRAEIVGPDLVLRSGEGTTGAVFNSSILNGLPSGPGCLMWGANRPGLGVPAAADRPFQTSLYLPFAAGGDALLRLRFADPAPSALDHPNSAPVGGTTSEPPSMVVSAGVSLDTLLADPAVAQAMDLRPRDARRVVRAMNIGPGTTAAFFGPLTADDLDWVVVLPVRDASPRKIARKGRRLLRDLDMHVRRGGPEALLAQGERAMVFGMADEGRLVLGTNPARVMEVVTRTGVSWLVDADAARLGVWPVVAWTGPGFPSTLGLPEGARLDLGLRAVDGSWEIAIHAEGLAEALGPLLKEQLESRKKKIDNFGG